MENPLDNLVFTSFLFEMLYDAKQEELHAVYESYEVTAEEFKATLKKKLKESGMSIGACNLAVDFLIVATKQKPLNASYVKAIHESILNAAIYYANVCGKDPCVNNLEVSK